LKHLKTVIALCLIGGACGYIGYTVHKFSTQLSADANTLPAVGMEAALATLEKVAATPMPYSYEGTSAAGSYLSGRFAQRHHDWNTAGRYIDYVLDRDASNPALLKRAMVLAMGSGDIERAVKLAQTLVQTEANDTTLARMFLAIDAFKRQNYDLAATHIQEMPQSGLSDFVIPLLASWSSAALGQHDTQDLDGNNIYLYHAILIADYLGQTAHIQSLLKQALSSNELSGEDIERIADIYAHIGEFKTASSLYTQALVGAPENTALATKIETVNAEETTDIFVRVKTPEQGVGEAMYDVARLLTQEYSDESARVFANMALSLNPDLTRAKFLLAKLASRNERYDEAIALYQSIESQDEDFLLARRNAADLFYEQGRIEEAISELDTLVKTHDDLKALIQIGDIYRMEENFKKAIRTYNQAAEKIGDITEDHWHLHYVRGMSYEQDKQWEKAEQDLQAALSFRPDHPYVLNYLGYAWADQDLNLDQALEMIERAVQIRPGDGYITDSLGWVYYRMSLYHEAVPYLEQAVELMPYDPTINDHLGDAYWKVGRTLEAEFQWTRAKNYSEDEELIQVIEAKLKSGIDTPETVKEAKAAPSEAESELQ